MHFLGDVLFPLINLLEKFGGNYDQVIYFITLPLLSEQYVNNMQNAADYDKWMKEVAAEIEAFYSDVFYGFEISVVTFDPLSPEHVKKCLRDQGVTSHIDEIVANNTRGQDWVPLGCKTTVQDYWKHQLDD